MRNNNYCVIMSGGVGIRFWPYSRKDRPKQFLDFFNTGQSLIQTTYDRFRNIIPAENIFIVTNEDYAELTYEQLPNIPKENVLLEPIRRNTAPCIAYACYRIMSIDPNANIVVTPSDHLIMDDVKFGNDILRGLDYVNDNDTILTLGIRPSRPETAYGYIQIDKACKARSEMHNLYVAKTFTEKPNRELSEAFFLSGEFLWNAGIFIWNMRTIRSAYQKYLPEVYTCFESGKEFFQTARERQFIEDNYPYCPNISIDYGILEKADNVNVLATEFGWSDLGTWEALYDVYPKDDNGNVTSIGGDYIFDESSDNIIVVPKDRLAVIEGLTGYIVIQSENALLICRREDEAKIHQFVANAKLNFGDKYI